MHISEFLETSTKLAAAEWARRFKISAGFLCDLKERRRLPSLPVALRIEKRTGGQVSVYSWVDDEEEEQADAA